MYTEVKSGMHTGGSNIPIDKQNRAEQLIELFEDRLQKFVFDQGIAPRYIRPLVVGSVICGSCQDKFFVGYLPQLGMPTVSFVELTAAGTGNINALGFHNFLSDKTAQDFSVVELRDDWLDLDGTPRRAILDAVVLQIVQSELSRVKVQTTMLPFNPVWGPHKFLVQENLVFVLMPFKSSLTAIYAEVVTPTVESKNLICRRADDISSNNVIMSDIWKSICEARFIIADLSTRNPNVMYELGISHTVGEETILIHQKSGTDRFPFDISHFRIIDYQDTATGGAALRNKLEATIDSVLQKLSSAPII